MTIWPQRATPVHATERRLPTLHRCLSGFGSPPHTSRFGVIASGISGGIGTFGSRTRTHTLAALTTPRATALWRCFAFLHNIPSHCLLLRYTHRRYQRSPPPHISTSSSSPHARAERSRQLRSGVSSSHLFSMVARAPMYSCISFSPDVLLSARQAREHS